MADNNADFTQKILIDVELKGETAKTDVKTLADEIQKLSDKNKVLEIQNQKNSKSYVDNASNIRLLKQELRETNKFIDNTSKAFKDNVASINFENNSITQNRALLSLLTAEHVKLGVANGNTKKQIDDSAASVNKLTTVLKNQEKQIGQTYRNVGNYEEAIQAVAGTLNSAIPGFQQFSQVLQVATKVGGFFPTAMANIGTSIAKTGGQLSSFVGFKQFGTQAAVAETEVKGLGETAEVAAISTAGAGTAAEGAAGGFTLMGAAAAAAIGVVAGVAAAIYGLIQYLKTLDSLGDGTAQIWAGIKASFYGAAESIRAGDWKGLADNMSKADFTARELTASMQDLGDALVAQEVHNAAIEEHINTIMLKMRNKRVSVADEKKYFDQIQFLSTKNYNERKKNADELYDLAVSEAANGTYLTKKEIQILKAGGVDKAIEYENQNKIAVGSYKKIAEAQKQQIAAEQFNDSIRERSQNRLDAKQQAAEQKAAAAAAKAEQLRQKQTDAYNEAQNIRHASENKVLQDIYEDYGDKAVAANQNYNNELTKLKKFHDKKLISDQEFNQVEKQITAEHQSAISKIIDDFRKADEEKLRVAFNNLRNLNIENIEDDKQRAISGLKQKLNEEQQAIDIDNDKRKENIKALEIEIKAFDGKAKAEAESRRETELSLIDANEGKRKAIITKSRKDIAEVERKAQVDINTIRDSNDVKEANNKFGVNSIEAYNAKAAQLQNEQAAEITVAGITQEKIAEIKRKYQLAQDDLDNQRRANQINTSLQFEQILQQGVFDIISQNAQANQQKAETDLQNNKAAELDNASLTNTQKKLIEKKYAKEDEELKKKAFKDNQRLQAANLLINGAVAISAALALPPPADLVKIGFIAATTAVGLAKIASQKPGFAKGGVFESDGRGGLLSGYSKTDNINSRLRSGEGIVVSEAMRDPRARNIVSGINVAYGGRSFGSGGNGMLSGFAQGGIFTDGGNANRYYSQPLFDQQGLATVLADQLRNLPTPIVDVKDVSYQQDVLTKTQLRVTL